MTIVNGQTVLQHALANKYAVAAFNANTLEQMMAIVAAAEAERAPVFLQVSQGTIAHLGLDISAKVARIVAEKASVPVVLHLDHGRDLEQIVAAIRAGLSSLMFDGSKLPYEENVEMTARAAQMAHAVGLTLEAELGYVPQKSQHLSPKEVSDLMTTPELAAEFVARTGVDSLAIAIGSIHGLGRQKVVLDLERLQAIRRQVDLPLVSHGTSGVRDQSLLDAIPLGLCKINMATRLNYVFTDSLRESTTETDASHDPRHHLAIARTRMTNEMRELIQMLNGSGRIDGSGYPIQ